MAKCSRKTWRFTSSVKMAGRVTILAVDKNDAVSDWSEGFFDQAEEDLVALSGWKT